VRDSSLRDLKVTGFRVGIERNSRYDFTNGDNVILTLGNERSFHRPDR
jgi:hypothetical protein